jgi:hypothetical protein
MMHSHEQLLKTNDGSSALFDTLDFKPFPSAVLFQQPNQQKVCSIVQQTHATKLEQSPVLAISTIREYGQLLHK